MNNGGILITRSKEMSRKSVIRKTTYSSEDLRGPDTTYVVDLFENEKLVESREIPGKSIYYANDVAENWENGIIKIEN